MNRRSLLAFFVFFIVLVAYMQWRAFTTARDAAANPPAAPAAGPGDATDPSAPADRPAPVDEPPPTAPAVPVAQADRDDQIVVDTDVLRARFTNHGAALLELQLKKYFRRTGVAGDPAAEAD